MEVFRRDSPTLVRLDVTYGKGSAASWIFGLLQSTFIFLGVTDDRMSKEQVFDLARTISSQYRTLKMAEVMLFVAWFKAGKYGRFYGGDSYALVVMEALNKFVSEREDFYARVEMEETARKIDEGNKNTISFEEYKRMKEAEGGHISKELEALCAKNNT